MRGNQPDDPRKDFVDRMADKLVKLGFASTVLRNDTAGTVTVVWTERGNVMRRELGLIFQDLQQGGEINIMEIKAMFALFLRTNSGK